MNQYINIKHLLYLLIFLNISLFSQSEIKDIRLDESVRRGTLENGLTYFIKENNYPKGRAELRLVVNVGSILEDNNQQGLAHFLEHMAFNGTKNFPENKIVSFLESIGMKFGPDINAYTSFDETVYMLQLPTNNFSIIDTGLFILSEWAHNISFDSLEIEKERGVVIEEWRLGRNASSRMNDIQLPVLFNNSRYSERLPIGKPEVIKNFNHSDLISLYTMWYKPELMSVIAVGDFDSDKVEALIKQHFSVIPSSKHLVRRPIYEVPVHSDTLVSIATDSEASSYSAGLYIKLPSSSIISFETYKKALIKQLFRMMFNQRLYELTRSEKPPFIYAYGAEYNLIRSVDAMVLYVMSQPYEILPAFKAILKEWEKIKKFGFNDQELDRQKLQARKNMENYFTERNNIESADIASNLVDYFLRGNILLSPFDELEITKELLPEITLEDILNLILSYQSENNLVVLANYPEKDDDYNLKPIDFISLIDEVKNSEVEDNLEVSGITELIKDELTAAQVVSENFIEDIGVNEFTLSNGVQVAVLPTKLKENEILFYAFGDGGFSIADDNLLPKVRYTTSIVEESGIADFDVLTLDKYLTGKLINLNPWISGLSHGFRGSSTNEDLETLFQLVYLGVNYPRKDSLAYNNLISRLYGMVTNRSLRPQTVFYDTVSLSIYDYNPRIQVMDSTAVSQLDMLKSIEFYKNLFSYASNFKFLFVGNVDLEKIKSLSSKYFGSFKKENNSLSWTDRKVRYSTKKLNKTVNAGKENKAEVLLFNLAYQELSYLDQIGLNIVEKYLDINFTEVIREKMSGVYSISIESSYERIPEANYNIVISFGCDPERIDEIISAIDSIIIQVRSGNIDSTTFQKSKEIANREIETSIQDNNTMLSYLISNYRDNNNFYFFRQYSKDVSSIKIDDFIKWSQQFLRGDMFSKFVLLPGK